MSFSSIAGAVTTVVSFVAFVGIVAWAWSAKRRKAFEEAANAPFALPDDAIPRGSGSGADKNAERRS